MPDSYPIRKLYAYNKHGRSLHIVLELVLCVTCRKDIQGPYVSVRKERMHIERYCLGEKLFKKVRAAESRLAREFPSVWRARIV